MKTVTILLTWYSGLFGRFICGISKHGYSYASISIDGAEEIFYSFNYKGFVVEKPKKRFPRSRMAGSMCIRMQVPEHPLSIKISISSAGSLSGSSRNKRGSSVSLLHAAMVSRRDWGVSITSLVGTGDSFFLRFRVVTGSHVDVYGHAFS